jgi:hypothetical protein
MEILGKLMGCETGCHCLRRAADLRLLLNSPRGRLVFQNA